MLLPTRIHSPPFSLARFLPWINPACAAASSLEMKPVCEDTHQSLVNRLTNTLFPFPSATVQGASRRILSSCPDWDDAPLPSATGSRFSKLPCSWQICLGETASILLWRRSCRCLGIWNCLSLQRSLHSAVCTEQWSWSVHPPLHSSGDHLQLWFF